MISNLTRRLHFIQADHLDEALVGSSLSCVVFINSLRVCLTPPVSSLQFLHLLFPVSPDSTVLNLSIYLPPSAPAVPPLSASAEYPAHVYVVFLHTSLIFLPAEPAPAFSLSPC